MDEDQLKKLIQTAVRSFIPHSERTQQMLQAILLLISQRGKK